MKRRMILAALVLPALIWANPPQWNVGAPVGNLRAELEQTPEKSGGIYFAYPVTADETVTVPEGFKPVFLTHYGRHGSRWCLKDYQYPLADTVFALNARLNNLTQLGTDVQQRLRRVGAHAAGHAGELSPLGERQHRGIAERMANRFPELFTDSTHVEARSSQVPRCIMSMAAFCERLKEQNPQLRIQRHATPSDMDFIAYDSPEAAAIARHNAPWRAMQQQMRDSLIQPERLMQSLFINPDLAMDTVIGLMAQMYAPKPKKKDSEHAKSIRKPQLPSKGSAERQMMKILHDIAVDLQDVDGLEDITLLDLFTPEERFNLWQMLNLEMYYRHANAEGNGRAGIESARSMLTRFISIADEALAADGKPEVPVKLHFGHDTNLIRLLGLMAVEGCARQEGDPRAYCRAWQDFRVSPMGANLQMVLFRNNAGRTLVLLRHNEQNAALPLPYATEGAPFYEWQTVRNFWTSKLK